MRPRTRSGPHPDPASPARSPLPTAPGLTTMTDDPGILPPRRIRILGLAGVAVALSAVAAAGWLRPRPPPPPEFFREPTAHEGQELHIRRSGLDETQLGRAWLREARRAVRAPLPVERAHAEVGRFVRSGADALGYEIPVEEGQRLEVELAGSAVLQGRVAVDLFRRPPDGGGPPARLRSLVPGTRRLSHEPRDDAELILRLQPELFASGGYEVRIRKVSALAFPVAGRDQGSVMSVFGAPREAGRRSHHGVDIFAPRGTPVVAAADGYVRRADETPIGGKVIWLRDRERRQSLYYAHLDSQLVRGGEPVQAGDTVGLVGNTGNARTTPPHLHFGIYRRGEGPVDPLPWIRVLDAEPDPPRADARVAGSWTEAREDGIRVRARPSLSAPVVATLERGNAVRVVGVTGSWYRVRLPRGGDGFLADWVAGVRAAQQ